METQVQWRPSKTPGEGDDSSSDEQRNVATTGSNNQQSLACFYRGVAYDEKGEYDKAIAELAEAIRLDPRYAIAYVPTRDSAAGWISRC